MRPPRPTHRVGRRHRLERSKRLRLAPLHPEETARGPILARRRPQATTPREKRSLPQALRSRTTANPRGNNRQYRSRTSRVFVSSRSPFAAARDRQEAWDAIRDFEDRSVRYFCQAVRCFIRARSGVSARTRKRFLRRIRTHARRTAGDCEAICAASSNSHPARASMNQSNGMRMTGS